MGNRFYDGPSLNDAADNGMQGQFYPNNASNAQDSCQNISDNSYYDEYDYSPFCDNNGKPISPRSARHIVAWYSVVLFVISIVLMVIMFVIIHSHKQLYDCCTVEVQGVVVDNIRNGSNKESTVFPVIRYEYNGRRYEQKSSSGNYPAQYDIGERLTIHINPAEPTEYYIDKDDSTAVIALSVLSAACLILGIMLVIVSVKSKRNEMNRSTR